MPGCEPGDQGSIPDTHPCLVGRYVEKVGHYDVMFHGLVNSELDASNVRQCTVVLIPT